EAWQQAWLFGTTFVYMRQVEDLANEDGLYRLRLSDGATLTSRTVVITTGARARRLDVPALDAPQARRAFRRPGASEAPAVRGGEGGGGACSAAGAGTAPGRPRSTWPGGLIT